MIDLDDVRDGQALTHSGSSQRNVNFIVELYSTRALVRIKTRQRICGR